MVTLYVVMLFASGRVTRDFKLDFQRTSAVLSVLEHSQMQGNVLSGAVYTVMTEPTIIKTSQFPAVEQHRHTEATSAGKLIFLESIRGFGALAVVFFHTALAFFPVLVVASPDVLRRQSWAVQLVVQTPLSVVYAGKFAVVIFFVLSGFVLSYSFFLKRDRSVLWSGVVRRYFRLTIPILASTLLAWALLQTGLCYNQAAAAISPNVALSDYYHFSPAFVAALKEGLTSVFYMTDPATTYNPVLWTMKTEFQGSFLVYGFLLLFGRWRWRWLAYLGLSVALLVKQQLYGLNFLTGMVICDAYTSGLLRREKIFTWPVSELSLLLLTGIYLGSYRSAQLPLYGWLTGVKPLACHSIGGGLIILTMLFSTRVKAFLSHPWCAWLGKISFALYLVHVPVLFSLGSFLYCWGHQHGLPPTVVLTAIVVTEVGVSLMVAWAFYLWIERPVLRTGKRVSRFFEEKRLQKQSAKPKAQD